MLTSDTLAMVRGWSQNDFYQAANAFAAANPDATGASTDNSTTALIEARVLHILTQRLNLQLAASPLLPGRVQSVADDLATFYGDPALSGLTTMTPDPVEAQGFHLGDALLQLVKDASKRDRFPALVVSQSSPEATSVSPASIGAVSDQRVTLWLLYALPWKPGLVQMLKAQRGAEAIQTIMRGKKNDRYGLWQDGKVEHFARSAPSFGQDQPLLIGQVRWSCVTRLSYVNESGL